MPSESDKLRKDIEQGPAKRDYTIKIPQTGLSPDIDAAALESRVNESSPVDLVPDEPFIPVPVVSQESKNAYAIEAATIENYATNKNHFELLDEALQSMNPKASLYEAADRKVTQDRIDMEKEMASNHYVSPADLLMTGVVTNNRMEQLEEERSNPHLAYVRALMKSDRGGEEVARKANELRLMEMIRDITDNMDWTDYATSLGGLMLPGNTLKDAYDVSGSAFSGETFMRNLVLNYKKMSPEEQAKMLPIMKQELFETLDNPIKVTTVLNAMLTPGGENDLDMFHNAWAGLEVFEIATLGSGMAVKIAELTKKLNAIKVAAQMGNAERASDLTTASVIDKNTANIAGVDRVEAFNLASPFNVGSVDPAYTQGLSTAVRDDLHTFIRQADSLQEELKGSDYFLREGLLDIADRTRAEDAFAAALRNEDRVENIEIVNRTGTTTTFRMQEGDRQVTRTLDLTLNDVGQFENRVTTLSDDFIFSPEVVARGELKLATAAAQRLDQAQARVWNSLVSLQREALKSVLGPLGLKGLTPTGRKQLAQLDHVLKVGDARKEVYTPAELRAGVDGVALKDNQIEAYLKVRKLVDTMHTVRNSEIRNEMVVRGMRNVNISDDIMEVGRPFETFAAAVTSLSQSRPVEIFDQALKQGIPLSRIDLEAEYAAGRRLVKLQDASTMQAGDAKFRYALVNAEDITDLPAAVINYRPGYIPKINLNAQYFVKSFKPSVVDGIQHGADSNMATISTVRVFDTRKDADAFARAMETEARANGDSSTLFRALEDRQIEKESRALGAGYDETHSLGGSLYTGSRKDEPLLFGNEGLPLETAGSFEAIGRNLANLSRFIPRNEWRMGMEQKAINTANSILPPNQRVTKFAELEHLPDTQQGRYLKWLHRQISDWMGFPTKEEQLWQNLVQHMYESALIQKAPNFLKTNVQWLKNKDPVGNARAAAFHSLLGWFNPVQLWVQAQGAAVAVSMNIFKPKQLAVVMRDNMALAASRYAQNPESIAHMAKAFGMKGDDLIEMNRAWQKSGIEDSILMTADHAAAIEGHGVAMDALSRAANNGLFFYRKGEMFNRRTAFATSYREWKSANSGKALTDEALKGIMKRTNDLMLNLGKANRAAFQKGAVGVTTQFLQVSTKTMETLLGLNGNFTASERAKIFMTQLLLYGSAGMGISSFGSRIGAGMLGYDDQPSIENEMAPEVRKALNEGFLGWATLAMFGVDADIGKRSSLLSGVAEFTDRMLFDDTEFAEMALGAFGSTGTRFWDAMTKTLRGVSYGHLSNLDFKDVTGVARNFASTISTWNNTEKALFMHHMNSLMTRKGKVLRRRDFTALEELAVGIGFSLSEEKQVYELQNILRSKDQFESKLVDEIVMNMAQYALASEQGELDEDTRQHFEQNIALLYQILPTHAERLALRDSVKTRLTGGQDEFTRTWNRFIKEFNDGRMSDLTDMHTKFTSYGIQQREGKGEE